MTEINLFDSPEIHGNETPRTYVHHSAVVSGAFLKWGSHWILVITSYVEYM